MVLQDLANNTAVTTTDDKNILGVWVTGKWDVRNHFLVPETGKGYFAMNRNSTTSSVRELIALSALDDAVKNQDVTERLRFKDQNVLIQTFFDV